MTSRSRWLEQWRRKYGRPYEPNLPPIPVIPPGIVPPPPTGNGNNGSGEGGFPPLPPGISTKEASNALNSMISAGYADEGDLFLPYDKKYLRPSTRIYDVTYLRALRPIFDDLKPLSEGYRITGAHEGNEWGRNGKPLAFIPQPLYIESGVPYPLRVFFIDSSKKSAGIFWKQV